MERKDIHIAWPGREELKVQIEVDERQNISKASLQGIGGPQFLKTVNEYRANFKGPLKDLKVPEGSGIGAIMLREMVLKLKGEWSPPYTDDEVCHCRVVATAVVDLAICTGAYSSRQVSELTSASTACGTCRPDVEAMIRYRLFGEKAD
jgi:bacterioferritin-associated ferredoxin